MPYVKGNRLDGQSRVARISQEQGTLDWPAQFSGAGLPPLVQTDQPNPMRRAWRTNPVYDAGPPALIFTPPILQPLVEFPNPTLRVPRAFPNYDPGRSAPLFPATVPLPLVEFPNPTMRPQRAYPLYDPGPAAPIFVNTTLPQLVPFDWPNPTLRVKQPYSLYDPGPGAAQLIAISPSILLALDWTNPTRRPARYTQDQYGAPQFTPAAGIAPLISVLDWPNPMRRPAITYQVYDPGQTSLQSQVIVVVPTVPNTTYPLLGI